MEHHPLLYGGEERMIPDPLLRGYLVPLVLVALFASGCEAAVVPQFTYICQQIPKFLFSDPPERTTLALLLMEFLLHKRYDLHFTLINP
ncbi:unnamed protein product [Boreogadus saida]